MKRLMIHLGYPKSASTTLQNGIFYKLHERNLINFIGRAFQSGVYGPAENKKDYKAWFLSVTGTGNPYEKQDGKECVYKLAEDKLNLHSEGLFITHEKDNEDIAIPQKIKEYFKNKADKIEVLIVLRSQQTLIMSDYVQTYHKIKEKSFTEYLNKWISAVDKKRFKMFNYYNIVSRYAETFGQENVHIVFFEDLVTDKDAFSRDLGAVLSVASNVVKELLEKAYFNKTPKGGKGSVVRKGVASSFGSRLKRVVAKTGIHVAAFDERAKSTVVPPIADDEKLLIFDTFKESNRMLAERFHLDMDRMKKYGYI